MLSRLIQIFILGAMIVLVCVVIAIAIWLAGPDLWPAWEFSAQATVSVSQVTPVPTFTNTPTSLPPTTTPTMSPTPMATVVPTDTPLPTPTPTVIPISTDPPPLLPTDVPVLLSPTESPDPTRPPIDFVVTHQRMRTNEENSWDGKVANNCGGDHTIYVQVVDAAGQPLIGAIVGDTYHNVRTSSGSGGGGPGQLEIKLWSNTMSLEVQGHIDGTTYTSEQTLPLSTRDEDIPTEWLFEGGYCGSMAECELRQQTNGLCRGHYSYDVTFQRTW